jgi:kynurenine formamidase
MCLPGTVEAVRKQVEDEGLPRVSRRSVLLGSAGAAAMAAVPGRTAMAAEKNTGRSQDLTHILRAGFPVYTFDPPTRRTLVTIEDGGFYSQEWTLGEHTGTHVDAPGHFVAGGRLAPEITVDELFVRVAVIDISRRAARDPDAEVTVRDLMRWEHGHGRIPRGAGVFMCSGWEERVDDPDAFKNADADGVYHFPGWSAEAVEWLLERRDIACIGVDTLSLDPGRSTTFGAHLTLLGGDKYGVENIANLKRIPARGARAFVGLVPWEEGSGGPCRLSARW